MMKLTRISVAVWATPNGPYTSLRRHYTNPDMRHMVRLYPTGVETYLFKGDMNQPFEPGIQHLARP